MNNRGNAQAYYSGMGYAAGYKRKQIKFKHPSSRSAFSKGYNKGISLITNNPSKYPKLEPKKNRKKKK